MSRASSSSRPAKGRMALGRRLGPEEDMASSGDVPEVTSDTVPLVQRPNVQSPGGGRNDDNWSEDWDQWEANEERREREAGSRRPSHPVALEIGPGPGPGAPSTQTFWSKWGKLCLTLAAVAFIAMLGFQLKGMNANEALIWPSDSAQADFPARESIPGPPTLPAPSVPQEEPKGPPASGGGSSGRSPAPTPDEPLPAGGKGSLIPDSAEKCSMSTKSLLAALAPASYDIELDLEDPAAFGEDASNTFSGSVVVHALAEGVNCVALHAIGIEVTSLAIWRRGEGREDAVALCGEGGRGDLPSCQDWVRVDAETESIRFLTGEVSGEVHLEISYQAQYGQSSGLVRSPPFPGEGGELESMITSQLQIQGARRVWPCIDEPSAKANYTIVLNVPPGTPALSNMPAASGAVMPVHTGDKLGSVAFETSPAMSPYLVAIAVGSIRGRSGQTSDGTRVTAWSTVAHSGHELDAPLVASIRAIEFYTEWTGFKLPLPKFDVLASPGRSGAMENWGLLIFDEDRFLVNNETEGVYSGLQSVNVVCHELAHQWFGDLVTCSTWEQIAVNEAFATFMEYKCMEDQDANADDYFEVMSVPPGYEVRVHFPGPRENALAADAGTAPHAVLPGKVAFDVFTYSKGGAILAMIEDFVEQASPGSFQRGMRSYLQDRQYGTATFLDALAYVFEQTEEPGLGAQFTDWVLEVGYPVMVAQHRESGDDLLGGLEVRQESAVGATRSANGGPLLWSVPVKLGKLFQEDPRTVLVKRGEDLLVGLAPTEVDDGDDKETIEDAEGEESNPHVLNVGGRGYYRAKYSDDHYATIASAIANRTAGSEWNVDDRVTASHIVSDMFYFVNQGEIRAGTALSFAATVMKPELLSGGARYTVLMPLLAALEEWSRKLSGDQACSSKLSDFIARLMGPFVGLQKSSDLHVLAEGHILLSAARHGDPVAEDLVCDSFDLAFAGSANMLPPDQRDGVYQARLHVNCTAEDDASEAYSELEACMQAEMSKDVTEFRRCLNALSMTRDKDLLLPLVESAVSFGAPSHMSAAEAKQFLKLSAWSETMREGLAHSFLLNHFQALESHCAACVDEIVRAAGSSSGLDALFADTGVSLTPDRMSQLTQLAAENSVWMAGAGLEACQWLDTAK